MEKRRPHYQLKAVKAQFLEPEGYRVTQTAQDFAFVVLQMDREDVIDFVQGIDATDFYKSMTSRRSHEVWQDVYRVRFEGLDLYVKFTMTDDGFFMMISLKEK